MDDFIKGLLIFQANGEEDLMGADHDLIYCGGLKSVKDIEELEALGWSYDDLLESFHYYV